ncbi:ribosome biogenesis protein WDR12-like protein [Dinothrombium tinctorium]|uniref:Ribosome biogenesis protein WDR12 homolog n=1 Tax=Dinothrombium tinctorium TaxID=1965070 RepID=A0A443REC9_9ACAR|nr:ribosome biogenesis protein WDR12-like protein [Dinothrombium tinctorium]
MSSFRIKFVTKQEKYAIPSLPYELSSSAGGKELNALINAVLSESNAEWNPLEFDFLIFDQLLKDTIEEHLNDVFAKTGEVISSENELIVEYIVKEPTPEAFNSLLNDDWVSCIHTNDTLIINGCYDGLINIWLTNGQHLISIPAHGSPVKDVCFVLEQSLSEAGIAFEDDDYMFMSASHDENIILWKFNVNSKEVDCLNVFRGHERSVDCIALNNDILASGSFDNRIKIWSLSNKEKNSESRDNSKTKKKADSTEEEMENITRTPLFTMGGHSEAVTDIAWLTDSNSNDVVDLASCSMDNTIRLWDIEVGKEKSTLSGSKAFLAMDFSVLNRCLITGSCDRHIRLWDPRSNEGSLVKSVFTNHQGWVSSICWSKTKEHLFISGGYDNYVKQWDTRCQKAPLYDLIGHNDKVLAVDWSNPRYIISGASDNHMRIFQVKDNNE